MKTEILCQEIPKLAIENCRDANTKASCVSRLRFVPVDVEIFFGAERGRLSGGWRICLDDKT